ncbi:metal-dependent transcriptional regulator [Pseudonocardia spinosispora]|uniref:metal-dependent transcriptional regulator n=1 Tax=Pseudonocardia spinosispora TaxID=103441 RepID=UPI0003FA5FA2|nr:metal-dependent transcriptional regulator [Pseudonocardia spinosispora]
MKSESEQRYSAAIEDYLKVIYAFEEREDGEITTSRLAERMGVSASSVSGMVRKLCELELLEHPKYGNIAFTDTGRGVALGVVRRHRLIELYLVSALGYGWDEVHDEAEVLEHAVSDRMLDRISERLGNPRVDPHGDPIPSKDGRLEPWDAQRLSTVEPGLGGQFVRVDDVDPGMLRHLTSEDISLGERLEVLERAPYGGSFVVRVGIEPHCRTRQLGPELVEAMWVRIDA